MMVRKQSLPDSMSDSLKGIKTKLSHRLAETKQTPQDYIQWLMRIDLDVPPASYQGSTFKKETWRDIEITVGAYEVSNRGQVRRKDSQQHLKLQQRPSQVCVHLQLNKKKKTVAIRRYASTSTIDGSDVTRQTYASRS